MLVAGLVLCDLHGLDQDLDRVIQSQVVELGALLQPLDGEIVGIPVVLVWQQAPTCQAHTHDLLSRCPCLSSGGSQPLAPRSLTRKGLLLPPIARLLLFPATTRSRLRT